MKKDIQIPKVNNVFMAVVKEPNEEFQCEDWNAYIVNNKEIDLEMVMVTSKGFDKNTKVETSLMRHKINKLPAKSFAKLELIMSDVLKLSNEFHVSFFEGNQLYDKKFVFEKGTLKDGALRSIPLLKKKGVLSK